MAGKDWGENSMFQNSTFNSLFKVHTFLFFPFPLYCTVDPRFLAKKSTCPEKENVTAIFQNTVFVWLKQLLQAYWSVLC